MRRLRYAMVVVVLAIVASACDVDVPPIATGTVTRSDGARVALSRELTPEQVRSLSAWFGANRSGWERSFVTPVPKLSLVLASTDGSTAGVFVLGSQLIVNARGTQMAKSLSQPQLEQFLSAIGEKHDG